MAAVKVLVVVIIITLQNMLQVGGCWGVGGPDYGVVSPLDHSLEVGSTLVLNCSLSNKTVTIANKQYHVQSSNIVFAVNSTPVPSKYVEVLDENSAQLRIENVTEEDTGLYFCHLNVTEYQGPVAVCASLIRIGYDPQPVEEFKCLAQHFAQVTCWWRPRPNRVLTNYTIMEVIGSRMFRKCADQLNATSCQWRLDTVPPYRKSARSFFFKLIGKNDLGTNEQIYKVDHWSIVLPDRPRGFKSTAVSKDSITVNWLRPSGMEYEEDFPPGLIFELQYRPEHPVIGEWMDVITEKNVESYVLSGLSPYINYSIRLRCRSSVAEGDEMWSEMSILNIRTLPDVPYVAPNITKDAFQVRNYVGNRTITLYWQPVPQVYYNGEGFHYEIEFWATYVARSVRQATTSSGVAIHNASYYEFHNLDPNTAYYFKLFAANRDGRSLKFSSITVDKMQNLPHTVAEVKVFDLQDRQYRVSWKPSNNDRFPIKNYTVFWFESLDPGSLQWTHVPEEQLDANITVAKATNYHFAVAANSDYASSGMAWSTCVVPLNGVLNKIQVDRVEIQSSSDVMVFWKLSCNAQRDVIKAYEIGYCKASEKDGPCAGPLQTKVENVAIAENAMLSHLDAFSWYKISLRTKTSAGISENSDPVYVHTLSGAPDDPPQNVRILNVNGTSIRVQWHHPAKPNGKILMYVIVWDGQVQRINRTTDSGALQATINTHRCYSNVSIQIKACTDLKEQKCSPLSDPVTALTEIGVPGIMDSPRVEVMNSSFVHVFWKKPLKACGPIDQYVLYVEQSESDNNTVEQVYNISGEDSSTPISVDCPAEDKRVMYGFQIRAVNKKRGQLIFGGVSEKASTHLCYMLAGAPPGPALSMIVGIAVGGALGLATLVFVLYMVARWMKKKVDLMKDIKVQLPSGLDSPQPNPLSGYEHFKSGLMKKVNDSKWSPGTFYGRLGSFTSDDEAKNRHGSGTSEFSNASTDELLYKKTTRCQNSGRNPSGDSSGCSSGGHDSISSSMTSRTHLSSDSGAEVDLQPPPSPDSVFNDTSPSTNGSSPPHGRSKPSLPKVDEVQDSDSKDSGLDHRSESPDNKTEDDHYTRFAHYLDERSQGQSNRAGAYSKFGLIGSNDGYVSVARRGVGGPSLYSRQLANSEPSVIDAESQERSGPREFQVLTAIGAPMYCKFALSTSTCGRLDTVGATAIEPHKGLDRGYSKFGMVHNPCNISPMESHLRSPSNSHYTQFGLNFAGMSKNADSVPKQSSPPNTVRPPDGYVAVGDAMIKPPLELGRTVSPDRKSNIGGTHPKRPHQPARGYVTLDQAKKLPAPSSTNNGYSKFGIQPIAEDTRAKSTGYVSLQNALDMSQKTQDHVNFSKILAEESDSSEAECDEQNSAILSSVGVMDIDILGCHSESNQESALGPDIPLACSTDGVTRGSGLSGSSAPSAEIPAPVFATCKQNGYVPHGCVTVESSPPLPKASAKDSDCFGAASSAKSHSANHRECSAAPLGNLSSDSEEEGKPLDPKRTREENCSMASGVNQQDAKNLNAYVPHHHPATLPGDPASVSSQSLKDRRHTNGYLPSKSIQSNGMVANYYVATVPEGVPLCSNIAEAEV